MPRRSDGSASERQGLLQGEHRPLSGYTQSFPGDPDVENNVIEDDRPRANLQRFPGEPEREAAVDIQAQAISAQSAQELRIEDTSRTSRRVKGAINVCNYWASNSNSCFDANQRLFGKRLIPVLGCGGARGSACTDVLMLAVYIWFSVLCPAFAIIGCVQIGFLIFAHGVVLEWIILMNNILAISTLCYIANIFRQNRKRFTTNIFCIHVPMCNLPGSINAFVTWTVSNIDRIQILDISQRNILASELQRFQDISFTVMLYTDHYMQYVYTRPMVQLMAATLVLVLLTLAQMIGMGYFYETFVPSFFLDAVH